VISGYRIFDAHAHIGSALHSGRRVTAEQMLRHMDAGGIDRALLIPYPSVADFRAEHDEIAAAVRQWPDRFCGAACMPHYDPAFRDEIRRAVESLGLVALKLQPQFNALNPLSKRNDFFWETAAAHRLPVVVHTGAGAPFALPSLYIDVARRFPELKIVLAHTGGSSYYLEAIVAAKTCPNIWLELSSLMPHHITEVLAHIEPARLMIGSDLPESIETEIGKIVRLAKPEILWDTPAGLFVRP
jgi:predicted TIM-barrel fold metal-dependent hydrolase